MAEIKTHPTYGEVTILQSSSALVEIEVGGDSFWVTAASFTKKKYKRAKKSKRVQKVDKLIVSIPARDEVEPEVFELEKVVLDDEEEICLEESENLESGMEESL